jgi:hypothetical protein
MPPRLDIRELEHAWRTVRAASGELDRIARSLGLRPPTVSYHLDALEGAGRVQRTPWTVHDRRKVAVRLTEGGRFAVGRLGAQPPAGGDAAVGASDSSDAASSPSSPSRDGAASDSSSSDAGGGASGSRLWNAAP